MSLQGKAVGTQGVRSRFATKWQELPVFVRTYWTDYSCAFMKKTDKLNNQATIQLKVLPGNEPQSPAKEVFHSGQFEAPNLQIVDQIGSNYGRLTIASCYIVDRVNWR